jgi:hypothetical protein
VDTAKKLQAALAGIDADPDEIMFLHDAYMAAVQLAATAEKDAEIAADAEIQAMADAAAAAAAATASQSTTSTTTVVIVIALLLIVVILGGAYYTTHNRNGASGDSASSTPNSFENPYYASAAETGQAKQNPAAGYMDVNPQHGQGGGAYTPAGQNTGYMDVEGGGQQTAGYMDVGGAQAKPAEQFDDGFGDSDEDV